MKDVTR